MFSLQVSHFLILFLYFTVTAAHLDIRCCPAAHAHHQIQIQMSTETTRLTIFFTATCVLTFLATFFMRTCFLAEKANFNGRVAFFNTDINVSPVTSVELQRINTHLFLTPTE